MRVSAAIPRCPTTILGQSAVVHWTYHSFKRITTRLSLSLSLVLAVWRVVLEMPEI